MYQEKILFQTLLENLCPSILSKILEWNRKSEPQTQW